MTGTSSSRGRLFSNFDSYKNQEWLRRRKLRIEQVRQQSSEIAKALRQKVENEEKLRNLELAKVEELKFKNWRAEKLDEMERKLRFALEEFGLGHRLIENEPDPKKILETRNELNRWKAQERGDIAVQEELIKKKLEKNKKMSSIERKKMARKLEDLRSALVCSLRTHKHFPKLRENSEILEEDNERDNELKNIERKTIIKKKRINPIKNQCKPPIDIKKVSVKQKVIKNPLAEDSQVNQEKLNRQTTGQKNKSFQNNDKIWIDLNDIQNTSVAYSNNKSLESKTTSSTINSNTGRAVKSVEFYDYNSRYQSKTFREYPNVVEKIETFNMPQDSDVYKETLMNQLIERKKEKADFLCKERGNKALKKERINRDYNILIAKLNDLHKKEKIIKTSQHVPTDLIHMNDARILEKTRNKQRVMNSKFESLYYETIANNSKNNLSAETELSCSNPCNTDEVDSNERASTKASFSPTNLRANSPAASVDFPQENSTSPKITVTRPKKKRKKLKRKLVAHIDKTLREGRELRESVATRNLQNKSTPSQLEESLNEIVKIESKLVSPVLRKKVTKKSKTFKNQISQTEDFEKKNFFYIDKEEKQTIADHMENDSLLVSTATSYKSPPCEIRNHKLIEFLQLSDLLSKVEGHQSCLNLKRKIEETLLNLLDEMQSTRFEDYCFGFRHLRNPSLKDYIVKLLNMSREKVANLSISAESTPTPDFEDQDPETDYESIKSEAPELEDENFKNNFDNIKSEAPALEFEGAENPSENIKSEASDLEDEDAENHSENMKYEASDLEDEDAENHSKSVKSELEFCSYLNHVETHKSNDQTELEKLSESIHNWKLVLGNASKSGRSADIPKPDIEEYSSEPISNYKKITKKCEKRIEELSNLLKKVREEKEKLLILPSESSNQNNIHYPSNSEHIVHGFLPGDNLSGAESIESLSITDSQSTIDTFPDVLEVLLQKKILTSPFKWYKETLCTYKPSSSDLTSIEEITHKFRKQMSKIRPCSFESGDLPTLCSSVEEIRNLK